MRNRKTAKKTRRRSFLIFYSFDISLYTFFYIYNVHSHCSCHFISYKLNFLYLWCLNVKKSKRASFQLFFSFTHNNFYSFESFVLHKRESEKKTSTKIIIKVFPSIARFLSFLLYSFKSFFLYYIVKYQLLFELFFSLALCIYDLLAHFFVEKIQFSSNK